MSIKARLILAISLIIVGAFAIVGVVTVAVARERMIERIDQTLLDAPVRAPRGPNGDGGGRGAFDDGRRETATLFVSEGGDVRLAIPSGYSFDPDPLPDISLADLQGVNREPRLFTTDAEDGSRGAYRVLARPIQGGYLVQAAPLDTMRATIANLIRVITFTGLGVLIITMLAVWFTVRRGLRPIDDMIGTAGLIADGNLSQRIAHADASTEVGQLGHALNVMLGTIESSFAEKAESERRLRQFVADASHELRTPLTSIRGYAELFRSGAAADPATLERVMLRIESEGERMGRLVEDLLLLARLDQGRPLERAPVDLVPLVTETVEDARIVAPDHPIDLNVPAEAQITGDANRLRQVIGNLLTNARVHTDPGTPIHVSLATTDATVTLTVADEGPGMTAEDAAHVFDRFYRADTSRARTADDHGTGLGLSIVASIVAAHHGHVTLDTAPGRGATFTVVLPVRGRDA